MDWDKICVKKIETQLREYDPKSGTLDLSHCDITGEAAAELVARLTRLSNLHTLNISYNDLSVEGAKAVARLADLRMLNIAKNRLTDTGAEAISKLSGLETLDIHNNRLTDAGAESISKLSRLQSLDISDSQLTDAGAEEIAKLCGLQTLNIGSNRLAGAGAEAIFKLNGLRMLNISNNQLADSCAVRISKLNSLQTLDVRDNQLGDADALAISKLGNLNTLNINHNQLTCGGGEAIAALRELHTLDIGDNPITDTGAKAIATLGRLCDLGVDGTRLTAVGAKAISTLTNLETLEIGNNILTEAGARAITSLVKLRALGISSAQLEDGGAAALTRLFNLNTLVIGRNRISNPQIIIDLCDRMLKRRLGPSDVLTPNWEPLIDVYENSLRWPGTTNDVSDTILRETDPAKLKALLESLRDRGSVTLDVAGIAMAGLTTHGKTHLSRWIVAKESEYPALSHPLDLTRRTWGYDRYATILSAPAQPEAHVRDLMLTIVDVGGHRQQLSAVSNLIYSNVRRSIFVLCIDARKDFKRANLGDYYLRLIENLVAKRATHEEGRRVYVSGLVARGDRIPVVIVLTHAKSLRAIQIDEKALARQFELLDIVVFDPWDISIGSERIQALRTTIVSQIWKLKALKEGTLKSFRPICDAIAARFELRGNLDSSIPPSIHSITMAEFREICAEHEENSTDFQDLLAKELAGIGYVAIVGSLQELEDDRPLLNPRFVNHYLFSKILKHEDTRRNHGFMYKDWFNVLTHGVSSTNKGELWKLVQHCLTAFEWKQAGFEEGVFIPDLVPERDASELLGWNDAAIEGEFIVSGFLGEHAFFSFAGHRQKDMEPIETVHSESGSGVILLYRNSCIVRDSTCKALVSIDLADSTVRIVVKGPDYKSAHSFGERVKGWMADEIVGELEGEWEESLFERLWLELNGASKEAVRALKTVKKIFHMPSEERDESWTQQTMADWLPKSAKVDRDKMRDSIKWLVQNQILIENPQAGYRLTNHTGARFIAWLSCKFPP